jgi:uncharacterized membrane protein YhaH (DUF805 family)
MGPVDAVKICFGKYVTFSGRAPRSEFWFWSLFVFIVTVVVAVLDVIVFGSNMASHGTTPHFQLFRAIWGLATLLPGISVTVRRLHDLDRVGWWYWLVLIPLVGAIWLLVWFCSRGTAGDNRFGPNPLAAPPGANPV